MSQHLPSSDCLSSWERASRKPPASGDYLTIKGMETWSIRAVLFGVPRSGTVFCWQMLCDLFPEGGVIHTHEYLAPPRVPAICTFRDPRDSLASNWRIDRPAGLRHPHRERIFWYAAQTYRFAWILRQYRQRCNPLVLRYEETVVDPAAALQKMADHAGVTVDNPQEIADRHSLAANRKLQEQSPPVAFHLETMLHSQHVGTGQPGTWRDWILESDWGLLDELLRPLMDEWGYE